jgi:hypothetical protein
MGINPATLAIISAVGSGVSAVTGFIGGQQQAAAAKNQANYNSQVEANRRTVEEQKQRRQLTLAQGTARSQAASSGATLNSFEDVLNSNQEQGLLDIALGSYDSQITRDRIRYEGNAAASQAKNQGFSSLLSGAAGVAGGLGKYDAAKKADKVASSTAKLAGK